MIGREPDDGDDSRYTAYAFDLSSPIDLPGFCRTSDRPEIAIEYGPVDPDAEATSNGVVRLSYEGVGRFAIYDGRRVLIDPAAGVSDASLRRHLVGPALAVVLHQRGYLALHASTVSIRGAAVAFLGPSGTGKSTLAAACCASGHALVSDDVTAIRIANGSPVVVPGPPLVKLSPDTAAALGGQFERLPSLSADKELYRVPTDPSRSTYPLERLYFVEDGRLRSEHLCPGAVFRNLVGHTYTHRLLEGNALDAHFRQCASLVDSATIRRLYRPADLAALTDVVSHVERGLDR